jgi:hypothetical protein
MMMIKFAKRKNERKTRKERKRQLNLEAAWEFPVLV